MQSLTVGHLKWRAGGSQHMILRGISVGKFLLVLFFLEGRGRAEKSYSWKTRADRIMILGVWCHSITQQPSKPAELNNKQPRSI